MGTVPDWITALVLLYVLADLIKSRNAECPKCQECGHRRKP